MRPWQMYPVGLVFGLGFDTASEIALLVLAGAGAASGLPWYAVLVLPLLFAAGMSLFDTLDGAFMNVAYDWAFANPIRKVYYNLTITGLSVAVAVLIGSIEPDHRAARQGSASRTPSRGGWPGSASTTSATAWSACSSSSGRWPWRTGRSPASRPAGPPRRRRADRRPLPVDVQQQQGGVVVRAGVRVEQVLGEVGQRCGSSGQGLPQARRGPR
ncbi:hypothetical protein GCM10025868_19270 [Angustibacter aerolatus]|uniref:Nickel/cobalt efflux system n=1 Tax=Angustibacter aerolatus TaxID=1162965 RepID=A0ABQ6JFV9_9ACTN|nr:hypothetical protein GCM10025868_19270 [Angustibacter aerolatus]